VRRGGRGRGQGRRRTGEEEKKRTNRYDDLAVATRVITGRESVESAQSPAAFSHLRESVDSKKSLQLWNPFGCVLRFCEANRYGKVEPNGPLACTKATALYARATI
jgi:hypothetical protein